MTKALAGKVAFITGGARGQGRSHAIRLAEAGADVGLLDICDQISSVGYTMSTDQDLKETVSLVESTGQRCVANVGDVRDRQSVQDAVEATLDAYGRIDFVIANAGIMPTYGPSCNSMDAWRDAIDVILTGTLNTVEATYPHLVGQGTGGSIVIVSSMGSIQPMMRTEKGKTLGTLAYCAAKVAVTNLGVNYASFLAPHNIRVNWIHPSGVRTPMVENPITDAYFAESDPEDLLTLVPPMPMQLLEPSDVSALVYWLCSEDSKWFTGNSVRLDGGAALR